MRIVLPPAPAASAGSRLATWAGLSGSLATVNIYVWKAKPPGGSSSPSVRFPYDDESPVAQAGTPEEREYQIIGGLADHEIGQPSDIATAVVPE